jgi:hypothetical protein
MGGLNINHQFLGLAGEEALTDREKGAHLKDLNDKKLAHCSKSIYSQQCKRES